MSIFDPSECYELSDFGFGPFPEAGATVVVYPPHPTGAGYGGSAYGFFPYGSRSQFLDPATIEGGYGGDAYGTAAFGSKTLFPAPPIPVFGGYGGNPYGYGPYGSIELTPPTITGAFSLDGFRIEVFFSEEMGINGDLLDPASYTLSTLAGAAPSTVRSVVVSVKGVVGATSVIVTHSGTTLGGVYRLTVVGPVDLSANAIEDLGLNTADLLTLGHPPTFTAVPISGSQVVVQFSHDMLAAGYFPGIADTTNYQFTPEPSYPVTLAATNVTHPYLGDAAQILLDVQGMTSLLYELSIEPAVAFYYDGSYLPSISEDFIGTEVGTGTSTVAGGALYLSKSSGVSYGWNFEDLTGKVVPASSFRVDFSFDVSSAQFVPTLFDAVLGALYINDGGVEAVLLIEKVAGEDVITIQSGAYSASVRANWSAGPSILTLVRNQYADIYAFLFNNTPLASTSTANYTGSPTIPSGVQFILGTTYQVTGLKVGKFTFTASQTVYSAAWNFLHDQTTSFTGSDARTKSTLLTEKGPLVKGWGDGTPATKQDVIVRLNGVAVEVASVNPYLGEVTLAVPVPLMPVGALTVEVDYDWFPVPTMELAGLNTPGLVLNKWDNPRGLLSTPIVSDALGAVDSDSRFPMRVVLGPIERPQPKRIGHRYLGFELDYSALLNNPTTLLLNQNPHSIAVEDFEDSPEGVSVGYSGQTAPLEASTPWNLQGVDLGGVQDDGETYNLVDASSGSFGVGTEGFYYQDVDLTFPSSVVLAARFFATSYEADGVFSGLAFGVHNNRRLFLVGCLSINGVQHLGMLKDLALPHLEKSWELGPKIEATILGPLQCKFLSASFPTSIEKGDRFQILSGPQAGTYLIDSFVAQSDGTTTVTVDSTSPFPENPYYWGNDKADAVFEVLWENTPSTYRLVVDTQSGGAQLYVSGEISSLAITLNSLPEVALAAQTTFMLDTSGGGQVFWGSLGRLQTNSSVWSFFRYGVTPQQTTFHSRGIVVFTDLGQTLPENDPNTEWFRTQDFGYAIRDTRNFPGTLLKSLSTDPSLDVSFGYGRVEPLLTLNDNVDFEGKFRVESGTLGFGDAQVSIQDTHREVRLGTVLYREDVTKTPYRQLVILPSASLTGLQTPEVLGWEISTGNNLSAFARGQRVTTTQALGTSGTWYTDVDLAGMNFPDEGSRILESRFRVLSYTVSGTGDTGILFGGEAGVGGGGGLTGRLVALTLLNDGKPEIALTSNGAPLQTYDFEWDDEELHTYRILVDGIASTVTLVLDDIVQTPTLALSSFQSTSLNTMLFLGAFGTDTAHVVEWDALSSSVCPPQDAKRTLGFWLGGDTGDIDNLRLPRTDGTKASNSTNLATLVEMDWRDSIEFRVHRDANWGVILQRPDLPLPPNYTETFVTEITEPSAGWISVEYAELPIQGELFGKILWGSLDAGSISQQRWFTTSYRIYKHFSDDYRSPQNMVLNRVNVITSGEPLVDTTPELVVVTSLSATLISLRPTNIFANAIYRVLEGDDTLIPYGTWRFDRDSQTIFLDNALSGENVPVTVVFGPGKPYTATYLEAQPLLDSITLLNEGTPPVPKQQQEGSILVPTSGSRVNDPNDVLNTDTDFILNDPYTYLRDERDENALYADMDFFEVTNGGEEGLLSSLCDDTFSGHGLLELGFSGGLTFQETLKTPIGDYTGISGAGLTTGIGVGYPPSSVSPSPFSMGGTSILFASGGGFLGGAVGTSLVYPNYPSRGRPGEGLGGINRGATFHLSLTSVFSDLVLAVEIPLEDSFESDAWTDAASATMETPAEYTRAGPWGGLPSLLDDSLVAGGAAIISGVFVAAGGYPLSQSTLASVSL